MKARKVLKWANRIVTNVLVILLIGVAALVLSTKLTGGEPEVFGYQLKTVLSGSMEPDIQTGSIIAVRSIAEEEKSSFVKGDVITFMEEDNKLVTHRIAEVTETGNGVLYTTKGDNNNAVDRNPVLADNVVAAYDGFTIPYIGYIGSFAQSPNGSIVFMIIPGILMLGYSGFTIWRALRQIEEKENVADAK
ncbi:signal peptidase I SipW [Oceanobacillus polygoni]|uniref:Signal peptidase I n=1 Tax=Oceanobacillus polygoni TaxID=1235259 RepID=A0A9X0YVP7_9BACI|nr:signal peptidase I [Oceanobacillus polygoni]MBP2078891.1 signal peptidase [Oceanobacillus polygoni]